MFAPECQNSGTPTANPYKPYGTLAGSSTSPTAAGWCAGLCTKHYALMITFTKSKSCRHITNARASARPTRSVREPRAVRYERVRFVSLRASRHDCVPNALTVFVWGRSRALGLPPGVLGSEHVRPDKTKALSWARCFEIHRKMLFFVRIDFIIFSQHRSLS